MSWERRRCVSPVRLSFSLPHRFGIISHDPATLTRPYKLLLLEWNRNSIQSIMQSMEICLVRWPSRRFHRGFFLMVKNLRWWMDRVKSAGAEAVGGKIVGGGGEGRRREIRRWATSGRGSLPKKIKQNNNTQFFLFLFLFLKKGAPGGCKIGRRRYCSPSLFLFFFFLFC